MNHDVRVLKVQVLVAIMFLAYQLNYQNEHDLKSQLIGVLFNIYTMHTSTTDSTAVSDYMSD